MSKESITTEIRSNSDFCECWSIEMGNAKCAKIYSEPNEMSRTRQSPPMYYSYHNFHIL